jgi:hypothetical protein
MVGGNGKTANALARNTDQLELWLETLTRPGFGHSKRGHAVKARFAMLAPSARAHHDPHHGEHDRHFDAGTASPQKFDAPIKADVRAGRGPRDARHLLESCRRCSL